MQTFQAIFCLCFIATMSQFHSISSNPTGFSLKLIHRDSPSSPVYPGNLTETQRFRRLMKISAARGHYLDNFSGPNASPLETDNIRFSMLRDSYLYLVQVAVGSQGSLQFLLMDTGGGLIWSQCAPCKNCYNQQYPIYNSQASATYRKLTCDHPLCSGPNPLYKCVNNECVYSYIYGGGATTKGVASVETFRFAMSSSEAKLVDGIIFGCSNDNQNLQFETSGAISGILGLSKSPDSLISQLYDSLGKRFSYCLVPYEGTIQAPSLLRFGDDIPASSGTIGMTKFVTVPGSNYYFMSLLDISVGSKRLGFSPDIFKVTQDGQGGCMIDSGTLITRINANTIGRNAYRNVMGAFQEYYQAKKLERLGQVSQGFALCYKNPPGFTDFVTMTYHFEGADYNVLGEFAHFFDRTAGYFCVAITPGNGRTIVGSWHQQNMRIVYNGEIDSLQFSTENCANDTPT